MRTDKYGQMIFEQDELFDILMHDVDKKPGPFQIEDGQNIDIGSINKLAGYEALQPYITDDLTLEQFDNLQQENWLMPDSYKEMDICEHVLMLCNGDQAQLQRCGEELLMYQDRDLFNLLRYLKYLVDIMELNNVIWGVGRGSSVSSYVLFKLRVHRIDSMFYDLNVSEFLR